MKTELLAYREDVTTSPNTTTNIFPKLRLFNIGTSLFLQQKLGLNLPFLKALAAFGLPNSPKPRRAGEISDDSLAITINVSDESYSMATMDLVWNFSVSHFKISL